FTLGIQKKSVFLLFLIIILFILRPSFADKVKQPINAKKLVPACLLDWNSGPEYAVLVDKSRQKVFIYKRDDLYSPYRVYDCSTGENGGRKQKRNDRKTPEGIYYFIKSYEDRYLAPIYGTMALPLDYPNIIDKRNGRGGYGIWFHGTNKDLIPKDTNGCVALKNSDIEELADIVSLFDTPVIIGSEIELVPEGMNEDQKRNIADIVESWRSSWEGKDINKYMSFYSRKFKSGWKDWEKWKAYKKRLAKKYNRIEVDVNDLNLFSHDGVIIASFEQDYRTSGFDSLGTKKLYLTQNSTEWKIIAETFAGYDKAKIAKKSSGLSKDEIKDFLSSWKDAWEKKDISGYISCYDKNFKSRGMDLDAWEKHRRRLNDKYDKINVEISNIKIQSLASEKKARVSFTQRYRADGYRDKGKKKILLVRKGKDWKIMEESWRRTR
ncbi:MAG: L,D-transpeptidase, partial [Desulfobacteraceae bacterium]